MKKELKPAHAAFALLVQWWRLDWFLTSSNTLKPAKFVKGCVSHAVQPYAARCHDLLVTLICAVLRCRCLCSRRRSACTALACSQCRSLLSATLSSSHQVGSMWLCHVQGWLFITVTALVEKGTSGVRTPILACAQLAVWLIGMQSQRTSLSNNDQNAMSPRKDAEGTD